LLRLFSFVLMTMRTGALALIIFACTDLGQGVKITNKTEDESARALAIALLASNPGKVSSRRNVVQKGAAAGVAAATALGGAMQSAEAGPADNIYEQKNKRNVGAGPRTREELSSLTYMQIKGTGLANTCTKVEPGGTESIKIGGLKRMKEFCLEPSVFEVIADDGTVEPTKLMTKQTYTLTGIEGALGVDGGKLKFTEEDGIDYAATTVQRPRTAERVPFLFTVKNLVATAKTSAGAIEPGFEWGGSFRVPSYRTGLFLDPKGRGMTTGYDQAVALPALQAGGDEALFGENDKKFDVLPGNLEMKVTSVNQELGEIGGVFVQQQPSDTDLGGKKPITVQLKGIWFAVVE
jgi:photosystem II oxygen-evolving enhancer protein 1